MEQTDLNRFKQILEAMLAELKDPLHRRDEISIESSPDTLDEVQRAGEREMAITLLENDSDRHRNLQDALQRIEDGTYGVCAQCDSDISLKRLNAVPWAQYCLECQSLVDQSHSQVAGAGMRFADVSSDLR